MFMLESEFLIVCKFWLNWATGTFGNRLKSVLCGYAFLQWRM